MKKVFQTTEVITVPTGDPKGGWYAVCGLTGFNFGTRLQPGEPGTKYKVDVGTPRRFKTAEDALAFGQKIVAKDLSVPFFVRSVEAVILQFSPKLVEPASPWSRARYDIQTPGGAMKVTAIDDWVACCFDDWRAASRYTGVCSNGKWNFLGVVKYRRSALMDFTKALRALMSQGAPA